MSIYTDEGYEDREDYLRNLAEDYEMSYEDVKSLADILGANEDFDALLTELDDYVQDLDNDDEDDESFDYF